MEACPPSPCWDDRDAARGIGRTSCAIEGPLVLMLIGQKCVKKAVKQNMVGCPVRVYAPWVHIPFPGVGMGMVLFSDSRTLEADVSNQLIEVRTLTLPASVVHCVESFWDRGV